MGHAHRRHPKCVFPSFFSSPFHACLGVTSNKGVIQQAIAVLRGKGYDLGNQGLWWTYQDDWWQTMTNILKLLKPLKEALDVVQADGVTLGQFVELVYPLMEQLINVTATFAPGDVRCIKEIVTKRQERLFSAAACLGNILDHRYFCRHELFFLHLWHAQISGCKSSFGLEGNGSSGIAQYC